MADLVKIAQLCDTNKKDELTKLIALDFASEQINKSIEIKDLATNNKYVCHKSTCIHIASQYSDIDVVESLLKTGASTNLTDDNKDTPLHSACRSSIDAHLKVQLLIKHDPNIINQENKSHITPLHLAVQKNDPLLCDILIKAGADVGALSGNMLTPLHVACHFNFKRCVELLLKHPDINVNLQDTKGDTPLHHCTSKGYLAITKMLQNHPKCISYLTNKRGYTADQESPLNRRLLKECDTGSAEIVKTVIKHGAICITDIAKETPMHKACKSAKQLLEKVNMLYNLEPKQLYMRNKSGFLPVHIAIMRGNRRLLEFFTSKGCINAETLRKRTPLSIAAFWKLDSTVEFLLSYPDCDVNAQDMDKNTAAHLAAIQSHDTTLKAIQAHPKYKFSILNKAGKTADDIKYDLLGSIFKTMCLNGPVYMVCRMLLTGTRLTIDSRGNTDLHVCCSSLVDTMEKCRVILETDPTLINVRNDDKDVPLHIACRGNNAALVRLFLEQTNVDVNAQNAKEWSPLHECIVPNNIEIVKALTSNPQVDLNILGNGYMACHLAASFHRREIMALIQSQPRYKCDIWNNGGQTVAQMWSTHGDLLDFMNTTWRRHKSTEVVGAGSWFYDSMTLIQGHLFCCSCKLFVFNLELEEVRCIPTGSMKRARQVSELTDGDLIAASRTGLYHLSFTGDQRVQVSQGSYNSVVCYNGRVYASNSDDNAIEIYAHNGTTWWGLRRIQLPISKTTIKLSVNSHYIYTSVYNDDTIYVYSHEGTLLSQHGGRGGGLGAGQFDGPLICNADDEGRVLIADCVNNRMQVLDGKGHCSLTDIRDLGQPVGAVYTPGRLYVVDHPVLFSPSARISAFLPEKLYQ